MLLIDESVRSNDLHIDLNEIASRLNVFLIAPHAYLKDFSFIHPNSCSVFNRHVNAFLLILYYTYGYRLITAFDTGGSLMDCMAKIL